MSEITVFDLEKNEVGSVDLSEEVFGVEVNPNLFYDVVRAQLASRRQGTHQTKTRRDIKHSTRKLYRQKGTGRARHGMISSPTMRGGGTVFGPHPRDYGYRPPAKMRKGALRSALSMKLKDGQITVLENFELREIKTKKVTEIIESFGWKRPLFVDEENFKLRKSVSNLQKADVLPPVGLNVYDVLKHDELVLTRKALEAVEGALKP